MPKHAAATHQHGTCLNYDALHAFIQLGLLRSVKQWQAYALFIHRLRRLAPDNPFILRTRFSSDSTDYIKGKLSFPRGEGDVFRNNLIIHLSTTTTTTTISTTNNAEPIVVLIEC